MAEWILEVSTLNDYVRRSLDDDPVLRNVRLRGEISNFKANAAGHWYFTLKDERSRIACVMFRSQVMRMSMRPRDGMSVILTGRVSLYEATGSYQFYADAMRPEGVGTLYQQFEALKMRLQQEGLFDPARKRPLPYRPRKIAVITSRTGAVLHDIRQVAAHRDPGVPLVLLPVQVQGEGAAAEIAAAIRKAGTLPDVDVMIVGRGGGSMEDLWAFNEEVVARAIERSPIPVISAVGHETDFTIADFVADRRAATPSNAAEMAVPDRSEIYAGLSGSRERLERLMEQQMQGAKYRLMRLRHDLMQVHPESHIQRLQQQLMLMKGRIDGAIQDKVRLMEPKVSMASLRLDAAMDKTISDRARRLERCASRLEALNPLGVLKRGYAIVSDQHGMVPDCATARTRQELTLHFADGAMQVINPLAVDQEE
ncbi:MAG: exodeoxyribonuclease VII large subunit [Clostridiales bacterium]|nr:exodeoxyribonuclease VII large subunit [Clostridiales bacterium]